MPLTDTIVRAAKGKEKPYKLSDGGRLHVLVNSDGSRYWRLAYRFAGKQKTLALGTYPTVTLADARARREEAKRILAAGTDPGEKRRADKQAAAIAAKRSLEPIAREWFETKLPGWMPSYSERLMSRLEADIFPKLGHRPISEIEPPDVLEGRNSASSRQRSGLYTSRSVGMTL